MEYIIMCSVCVCVCVCVCVQYGLWDDSVSCIEDVYSFQNSLVFRLKSL